jgi:hypothetical protein
MNNGNESAGAISSMTISTISTILRDNNPHPKLHISFIVALRAHCRPTNYPLRMSCSSMDVVDRGTGSESSSVVEN